MKNFLAKHSGYLVFAIALAATLGSLYFQYIQGLPPCVLCWFQRIMVYPLVFVSAVGILAKDEKLPYYVLPISTVGLLIAIYHNLLFYGVIAETFSPCSLSGPSCIDPKTQVLVGAITIPMLSAVAFLIICILMIIKIKSKNQYE
jgi:disulfide bond formation protein DsbB